ncbi:ABC transporter ATP-binding protein [Paenibacillus oenotherae]|uniref:ABC transporter ATP-binding protein n=1 Tax=Paenibacillus oenotherae TaxID=1435645 RepID=A0ABS7DAJ0_9BACL|nr:ABC transporter ATP-binding protein [Paenibacillus oenotherae]MBW7476168.1 ABC transporter ATP-binding protein [Paenibacillus oenotherae]
MIQLDQVAKGFRVNGKSLPILNIPSWEVAAGEKIAIIGPSGSGKSTLLHLLGGIMGPDSGGIYVQSHSLHEMSQSRRDQYRAANVGYIMQEFHLIPSLTAGQNVELVMPVAGRSRKQRNDLLHQWFHKVGLEERIHHLPAQLSRGQQQRVAIIRALINNPPLVLADEPTGSLDWETAGELTELLLKICMTSGMTLITVTHDLNLAQRFTKCLHISDLNKAHRTGKSTSVQPYKEHML